MAAAVHLDCINASNPYHECTDYCLQRIAGRKSSAGTGSDLKTQGDAFAELPKEFGKQQPKKKRFDPSQAYDEGPIAEEEEDKPAPPPKNVFARPVDDYGEEEGEEEEEEETRGGKGHQDQGRRREGEEEEEGGRKGEGKGEDREGEETERELAQVNEAPSYESMSERQKKLFDLKLKMNQARKANQGAVVAETKKEQRSQAADPQESRGVSKAKWYEEKQKRMGKVLEANGLDMGRAHMLDTQEHAEEKYRKGKKKEAAFGWDVFNQKTLYKSYKKRAANIDIDMDEYQRQKESDPDFYRDGACLEYGKAPDIPAGGIERMVAELEGQGQKRKEFSRRRRHHEEKDVDSINSRNEHFNRKIERAFGKYTVEIKNNLERGTALPD